MDSLTVALIGSFVAGGCVVAIVFILTLALEDIKVVLGLKDHDKADPKK